jgi:hypothetical protein
VLECDAVNLPSNYSPLHILRIKEKINNDEIKRLNERKAHIALDVKNKENHNNHCLAERTDPRNKILKSSQFFSVFLALFSDESRKFWI